MNSYGSQFSRVARMLLVALTPVLFGPAGAARGDSIFNSYENGFGAWTPSASGSMFWSVTRSQDQAHDGIWSLDFTANDPTSVHDDGTVWVFRPIQVTPGTWDISMQFYMWSPSEAFFGSWEVVAFIDLFGPGGEGDFTKVGNTHMAEGWHPYSYAKTITVNEPTTVYVAFGYNIVFEVIRTHYFDSVTISGIPLVCDDPACDTDGVCEAGEDCQNCPCDCVSASGGICGNGICEAGDGEDCVSCAADCNGRQSGKPANRFCCGDGDGQNPLPCSDSACSTGGWSCTGVPVPGSCCGDGFCEGSEDETNCAIDCACVVNGDCDDADPCTIDTCTGGVCLNDPIDCDDFDVCTVDSCSGGLCFNHPIDCDDGEVCTTDSCDAVIGCENTWPACGLADGCCGPACDPGNDPDCFVCGGSSDPCSVDEDCCSLKCKGNGTCR